MRILHLIVAYYDDRDHLLGFMCFDGMSKPIDELLYYSIVRVVKSMFRGLAAPHSSMLRILYCIDHPFFRIGSVHRLPFTQQYVGKRYFDQVNKLIPSNLGFIEKRWSTKPMTNLRQKIVAWMRCYFLRVAIPLILARPAGHPRGRRHYPTLNVYSLGYEEARSK